MRQLGRPAWRATGGDTGRSGVSGAAVGALARGPEQGGDGGGGVAGGLLVLLLLQLIVNHCHYYYYYYD